MIHRSAMTNAAEIAQLEQEGGGDGWDEHDGGEFDYDDEDNVRLSSACVLFTFCFWCGLHCVLLNEFSVLFLVWTALRLLNEFCVLTHPLTCFFFFFSLSTLQAGAM